ncbi:hypothetical protein ABKV19_009135 [Rosa sericea]
MLPAHYILVLLALLFPLQVAKGTDHNSASVPVSDWLPIKNIRDCLVIDIAKWAVDEYYSWDHIKLVFQNVTKGDYKDVQDGILYRLFITAKDDDSFINKYPVCKAVISRRPRDRFNKLISFYKPMG